MSTENKETEYLNQIIKLQNELINFLKGEVERLKVAPVYYPPVNPFQEPYNPTQQPPYPGTGINPWIITSGCNPSNGASVSTIGHPDGYISASSVPTYNPVVGVGGTGVPTNSAVFGIGEVVPIPKITTPPLSF